MYFLLSMPSQIWPHWYKKKYKIWHNWQNLAKSGHSVSMLFSLLPLSAVTAQSNCAPYNQRIFLTAVNLAVKIRLEKQAFITGNFFFKKVGTKEKVFNQFILSKAGNVHSSKPSTEIFYNGPFPASFSFILGFSNKHCNFNNK